jgi:Flavin containing amine oxidoreductase
MVLGGYGQLTDAMAASVADLRLNAPVATVASAAGGSGVRVTTRDGDAYEADLAIVSVPVGVLKAGGIVFEPALPAWKQEALAQIGMGKLNKARAAYRCEAGSGLLLHGTCCCCCCRRRRRASCVRVVGLSTPCDLIVQCCWPGLQVI